MSVGTRDYKLIRFLSSSADETQVVPITESGAAGKLVVYARRISGTGTATLAINGAFRHTPVANDLIAVKTATSIGTGLPTPIIAASDDQMNIFPYLSLTLDRTGTSSVYVFVVSY